MKPQRSQITRMKGFSLFRSAVLAFLIFSAARVGLAQGDTARPQGTVTDPQSAAEVAESRQITELPLVEVIHFLGKQGAIFHAHMKDTVLFPENVDKYGILNFASDKADLPEASATFRAVGYGHSASLWKAVKAYMDAGYEGILSIENEDPFRDPWGSSTPRSSLPAESVTYSVGTRTNWRLENGATRAVA